MEDARVGVSIKVIGAKPNSDEYLAALKVKEVLENEFDEKVMGEVILHANAYITGSCVKDIDLMMMGSLQNYRVKVDFTNNSGELENDNVEILSFCTAIEVKSHDREGIMREGTELYVRYEEGWHSATTQSNEQKNSIFSYFKHANNGSSPYVTNVIFFTGVTNSELDEILSFGDGKIDSNVIGSDFSARDLFQVIVLQHNVRIRRDVHYIEATNGFWTPEQLESKFQQFARAKAGCGELTRKRIEMITSKSIQNNIENIDLDKMNIFRGRAGTGKTIALIQKAIQLVDEEGARVLILTYNHALVSDIKRLFALADLPDMFQPKCVDITTMHAFFYKLINKGLYDNSLTGDDYLEKYDSLIDEMNQFLRDDDTRDELLKTLKKDFYLNWDYCFVDEAQDWTEQERDVLIRLFGNKLLIADGGMQFVRSVSGCDWNIADKRNSIKLKKSLRQGNHIITYVNDFLKMLDSDATGIQPNEYLPGGTVTILENNLNGVIKIIKEQLVSLKKSGNIPYDLLVLVPQTYVDKEPREFKYRTEFLKNDIDIWDGTNINVRGDYSINNDQIRVLQYDSGRGLEGWTVVCLELDTFLDEKKKHYRTPQSDLLMLESEEDQRRKFVLNWLLLPLTRPIDNLIITFKDPNSTLAKKAYEAAKMHPEYIKIER